jgi:hypothetical protein
MRGKLSRQGNMEEGERVYYMAKVETTREGA